MEGSESEVGNSESEERYSESERSLNVSYSYCDELDSNSVVTVLPSLRTGSNMEITKDKELYKSKLSIVINCNLHTFVISLQTIQKHCISSTD